MATSCISQLRKIAGKGMPDLRDAAAKAGMDLAKKGKGTRDELVSLLWDECIRAHQETEGTTSAEVSKDAHVLEAEHEEEDDDQKGVEIISGLVDAISQLKNEIKELRRSISTCQCGEMKSEIESLKGELAQLRVHTGCTGTTQRTHQSVQSQHASTVVDPVASSVQTVDHSDQPYAIPYANAAKVQHSFAEYQPVGLAASPAQQNNTPPWQQPGPRHRFRVPSSNRAPDRTITSTYVRPRDKPQQKEKLQGTNGTPRGAFYVGRIDPGCAAQTIVDHCSEHGVEVLTCRVSTSRVHGTAFAHLVVPKVHARKICTEDFWPDEIYARAWKFGESLGAEERETEDPSRKGNEIGEEEDGED